MDISAQQLTLPPHLQRALSHHRDGQQEEPPVEFPVRNVNSLNRFKKKNNDFIRRFTAGVRLVELDSSGRFLIPKDLIDFANISKDIVISSSVNIIEIWDKSSYEKVLKDSAIDFAALAEDVMGNDD